MTAKRTLTVSMEERYDALLVQYFALVAELVKLRHAGFNPTVPVKEPRAGGDVDRAALARGEAAGLRKARDEFIDHAVHDLRSKNPSISETDARREALVLADQAYGSGEPLS